MLAVSWGTVRLFLVIGVAAALHIRSRTARSRTVDLPPRAASDILVFMHSPT